MAKTGKKAIRIAIADDHPLIRKGVRMTFEDEPDFEFVSEGATADEAVEIALQENPNVMLLDVSLPGDGIEAAKKISERAPSVRVAMMTIHDDIATVRRSLKAGVYGYITKGSDAKEIVECSRKIAAGERYLSPDLAIRLLAEADVSPVIPAKAETVLTARERQLLDLLAEGLSNQGISKRTGLAEATVKQYVSALIQKLGVKNRTAAALMARTLD